MGLLNENFCLVLVVDSYSVGFLSVILLIVLLVLFYRHFYIEGDLAFKRFNYLVLLFVLSMVLLVLSPSLILIIFGWDGLGMVSFLLVIYYNNISSLRSGMVTIYTNRLGDIFFVFAFFFFFWCGVFEGMGVFLGNFFVFFFFILLSAVTKRAQIPFSSWLPAAIAAPTPVSSLVHSSTLVTAGVYLLLRFFFFFSFKFVCEVFFLLALLTSFISGVVACIEVDLKKLVAISTLSQLGVIIFILFLGRVNNCFFHLLVHALFKSLLFLSCGFIIIINLGLQDMRFLGVKIFYRKVFFLFLLTTCLRMCGLPFLSGYFSKDYILEVISLGRLNLFSFLIFIFCCGLSIFYRVKLIRLGLYQSKRRVKLDFTFFSLLFSGSLIFLLLWRVSLGGLVGLIFFDFENYLVFFLEKLLGVFLLLCFFSMVKVLTGLFFEFLFLNFLFGKGLSSLGFFSFSIQVGEISWVELFGGKSFFYLFTIFRRVFLSLKKFFKISIFVFLTLLLLLL